MPVNSSPTVLTQRTAHNVVLILICTNIFATICRYLQGILIITGIAREGLLPRDAMRKRGLCCRLVSVHLSVRLTRWWVVSTQLKISSNFLFGPVA